MPERGIQAPVAPIGDSRADDKSDFTVVRERDVAALPGIPARNHLIFALSGLFLPVSMNTWDISSCQLDQQCRIGLRGMIAGAILLALDHLRDALGIRLGVVGVCDDDLQTLLHGPGLRKCFTSSGKKGFVMSEMISPSMLAAT